MIAGLHPYARGGVTHTYSVTLREIPLYLHANIIHRERPTIVPGRSPCTTHMRRFGLSVASVFDEVSSAVPSASICIPIAVVSAGI